MAVTYVKTCGGTGSAGEDRSISQSLFVTLLPLSMLGLILLFASPIVVGGQSVTSRRSSSSSPYKKYSGVRASQDSLRQVYYHEQTVAVVELAPGSELISCEFIEVYTPEEVEDTMSTVQKFAQPVEISFKEMVNLMSQCDSLKNTVSSSNNNKNDKEQGTTNQNSGRTLGGFPLFSGILPGTKWCGLGDIAENYYDLGQEVEIDKCCRTHDICPVKVRAHDTRYHLNNNDFFTKSHCECDKRFYDCLKATKKPTADTMGIVYFNIGRTSCVDDVKQECNDTTCDDTKSDVSVKKFRRNRKRY